ncbi:YpbF family protein [Bacillus sp. Marseille-Q1617]|uniref:YpbF family protein n=1 Tax=Bacillus sp. Marseille-Q1617 TaxID=2736887 RepID=UPI00158C4171|nr:YpbF family protein [Bacillus sp. Marseille-Q1617]
MHDSIREFEDWTDPATKQMLNNLVERKQKFDLAKKRHLYILWIAIMTAFCFLYYLTKAVLEPYSYSFGAMFSVYVSESLHLFISVFLAGLFGAVKVLHQLKEKKEKEYQDLRKEIIDRSKDLWKEEAWKKRHQVFDKMKSQFDINLYHGSK